VTEAIIIAGAVGLVAGFLLGVLTVVGGFLFFGRA
jgi:hypothetical protein